MMAKNNSYTNTIARKLFVVPLVLILAITLSFSQKDSPREISSYNGLTSSYSNDKHYEKGMQHMKAKEYDKAIKAFDKSIKSNPENGEAYKQRGLAKYELIAKCSIYNAKKAEGTPEKTPPFDKDSAKDDLKKAKKLGCETDKETLFMIGVKPSEL